MPNSPSSTLPAVRYYSVILSGVRREPNAVEGPRRRPRHHRGIGSFSLRTVPSLALVPILLIITSFAQQTTQTKVFRPADYPSGKFKVTRKDFPRGDVTIRVIEVKNLGYTMAPDQCRAWLEVRKGSALLKQFYYADIRPVGNSFGIFLPKQQAADDYFVAVKGGDYDGRLLLVGKDGATHDLPGGYFFLTEDQRFLVSEYSSDLYVVAVFDLKDGRKVLEARNLPEIGSWYHDDSGYFFMEYGKPGHAERLDLVSNRLIKIRVTPDDIAKAHKVRYDFALSSKTKDCTAEPQ
jgi:hypothetical protein